MQEISRLFGLKGKVAIITGSSKGIGKAIAQSYASLGARVVVSSRKEEACNAVVKAIEDAGGQAIAVPCNISSDDDLNCLVDRTLETWGGIDVLVCNAAVNPYFGPLSDITLEAYRKTVDANIYSNMQLSALVYKSMAKRDDGSIIYISSIAGVRGSRNLGIYAITKAADMQLARSLAVEYGQDNIRVNCIAPGLIKTDFSKKRWENDAQLEKFLDDYPVRRIGEPEDVVGAAVLLAGNAGTFITGQTIFVDGGVTISGG